MEMRSALTALAALGQESRLTIFRLLVQAGTEGMTVGEIGRALSLAPATLSFHLKELSHAGMISPTASGRHIVYAANFGQMNELLAYLTENCCRGNPGACRPATLLPADGATRKTIRKKRKTA